MDSFYFFKLSIWNVYEICNVLLDKCIFAKNLPLSLRQRMQSILSTNPLIPRRRLLLPRYHVLAKISFRTNLLLQAGPLFHWPSSLLFHALLVLLELRMYPSLMRKLINVYVVSRPYNSKCLIILLFNHIYL